jgi:hypothetical protein
MSREHVADKHHPVIIISSNLRHVINSILEFFFVGEALNKVAIEMRVRRPVVAL